MSGEKGAAMGVGGVLVPSREEFLGSLQLLCRRHRNLAPLGDNACNAPERRAPFVDCEASVERLQGCSIGALRPRLHFADTDGENMEATIGCDAMHPSQSTPDGKTRKS